MKLLPAFLLSFIVFPCLLSDLAADRAALVAFRAAMGGRPRLQWNLSAVSPCSWVGVVCDQSGVSELRLPAMGLSGQLPIGLGNLTRLQTLSLRFNALSGRIPADFGNLGALRNLYLQDNFFSGEIPGFLFNLQNLVRLNMANNNFSGEIPSGFNSLTRLATLFLENNQLTGAIPDLTIQLAQFNVSFNRLNGSIPSKLSGMPASAFEGNSLCGIPLQPCNTNPPETQPAGKKKLSAGAIAGIVIGGFFLLVLLVIILTLLCRRKTKDKPEPKEITPPPRASAAVGISGEKTTGSSDSTSAEHMIIPAGKVKAGGKEKKRLVFYGEMGNLFDLEDLLRASAEVLGKGTFGTAYKATLEMGIVVAVKRLKEMTAPEKEFREKMEELGRMKHQNLVCLRAYYYSREEKLLVYDYLPMGSLSALLHGNREAGRTPLNWEARSGIALGTARGIQYLHSQSPSISHGNLKSSNILLSDSLLPRLSDFSLSPLAASPTPSSRLAGYRAPEVTDCRRVSQKADVYSFGVVVLELLTGRAPSESHAAAGEEGVDLPRWVQSVVQEEWTAEVFDEELLRYRNVEEEMVQLLEIGLHCTAMYPDHRPPMGEVVARIEDICRSTANKGITTEV